MGGRIHLLDIFLPPQFIVFFVMFPVIIVTYIFSQLKQPILEILSFLEHVGFLVESQKGFLHDIQSIFLIAKIGVGKLENLILVKPGQSHESLSIPAFCPLDKSIHLVFPVGDLDLHFCYL